MCVCTYIFIRISGTCSHGRGLGHVPPQLRLINEGDMRLMHWSRVFGSFSQAGIQCTKNMLARGIGMEWKSTPENISNFFQMFPINLVVGMLSYFPLSTFYSHIFKYEMSKNKVFLKWISLIHTHRFVQRIQKLKSALTKCNSVWNIYTYML